MIRVSTKHIVMNANDFNKQFYIYSDENWTILTPPDSQFTVFPLAGTGFKCVSIKFINYRDTVPFKACLSVKSASGTIVPVTICYDGATIIPYARVITGVYENIATTSLDIKGSYSNGTLSVTSQGFEIKAIDGEWEDVEAVTVDGNMTASLQSLSPLTEYLYRAYAVTTKGKVYGTSVWVRTRPEAPTLVTSTSGITQTSVNLTTILTKGSEIILNIGYEYKLQEETSWEVLPLSEFTARLEGLNPLSDYDIRAYATTSLDVYYSEAVQIQTLAIVPPQVVLSAPANVTTASMDLSATITNGSESIIEQGFEYKETSAIEYTKIVSIPVEGVISESLSTLTANTSYDLRAFVTTESGTITSTVTTISTLTE